MLALSSIQTPNTDGGREGLMAYLSYYRKYRPQTFEEVVGQEHITRTLQNAVRLNRLAHAYLFSGPRGTGKTTTARILAKSLNCEKGPTPNPCGQCPMCQRITSGYALDIMEIDGASNRRIDEIRELRDKIKFVPTEGRFKVYIIDEVHMLTDPAFNALLKTLEEPPAQVIFVLATTQPHKLPATILSRCQRFDFKRISIQDMIDRLGLVAEKEGLKVSLDSLTLIARSAQGSMRDSLSILDQIVSYTGEKIELEDVIVTLGMVDTVTLFNLVEVIADKNCTKALELVDQLVGEGKDLRQVCKDLIEYFRNLLLVKVCENVEELVVGTKEFKKQLYQQAESFSSSELLKIISALAETESSMRWEPQERLLLEVALIRLTSKEEGAKERVSEERMAESRGDSLESLKQSRTKVLPIPDQQAEELSLERVQRDWSKVLEGVKAKRMSAFPLLVEGKPIKLEGGVLTLGFKKESSFHKEHLQSRENKGIVEEVLANIFQEGIKIACVSSDEEQKEEGEPPAKVDLEESPLVEKTLSLFEGSKIVGNRQF